MRPSESVNFEDPDYRNVVLAFYLDGDSPLSFTTGPASSPIFIPGTYLNAGLYSDEYSDSFDGTATITDLSAPPTTVTPEPSTLALLGTGVLAAAGALRRRVIAR